MGISRKEFREMPLGEFWERHYYYEYSRADKLHMTRLIMSASLMLEGNAKLKDIIHIPIIDDVIYDDSDVPQQEFTAEEIAEIHKNLPTIQEIFEQMDKEWREKQSLLKNQN